MVSVDQSERTGVRRPSRKKKFREALGKEATAVTGEGGKRKGVLTRNLTLDWFKKGKRTSSTATPDLRGGGESWGGYRRGLA